MSGNYWENIIQPCRWIRFPGSGRKLIGLGISLMVAQSRAKPPLILGAVPVRRVSIWPKAMLLQKVIGELART